MKKLLLIGVLSIMMSCKKKPQFPFNNYSEMVQAWGKPDASYCIADCSFNTSTVRYIFKGGAVVIIKSGVVQSITY